jgi:ABC-2 type transport system permease protein
LLSQLVRKDLKVKYQGSAVGFAWSLANPLFQLGIYYVIFTKVFRNPAPDFHVYLMAGLLRSARSTRRRRRVDERRRQRRAW